MMQRLAFRVLLLLASLALVPLMERAALAGSLAVDDQAHVLASGDAARLRQIVDGLPFDARFVTTADYADSDALGRFVGTLVSSPNMVAVGVDPQRHRVQVHFGTRSGVPHAEWPGIERAGNDAFRRGDWEQGAEAIFARAGSAVSQASPGGVSTGTSVGRQASGGPSGLVLALIALAVIAGVVLLARRARSGAGYGGGYSGGGYAGPGPGYGGYPPGYGPQGGGMGPLGAGVLGAGLGGVAGYELGKMAGEREERDRLRDDGSSWDGGSSSVDDSSSYDAGGGGSSWDSGSGSGGSSGGGFDGGGGGGSDF